MDEQISPEKLQQVMAMSQQQANAQIMQDMVKRMFTACFETCATTSVRIHDLCTSSKLSLQRMHVVAFI